MNIDMSTLRALEREKDIAFELVCEAIEAALLTAYHHTEGSATHARVELDRRRLLPARTRRRGSSTTRRPTSAGSRRPPPSRSSCSGSATPSRS
jgi:hypothetical protein